MPKEETTRERTVGWVYRLNKEKIINQLKIRNIEIVDTDTFEVLRKRLIDALWSEIKGKKVEKEEDTEQDNVSSSIESLVSSSDSDEDSNMSGENNKLLFRLAEDDWERQLEIQKALKAWFRCSYLPVERRGGSGRHPSRSRRSLRYTSARLRGCGCNHQTPTVDLDISNITLDETVTETNDTVIESTSQKSTTNPFATIVGVREMCYEAYKDNHFNKQNVNANTDNLPVFEHNKPIKSYADVTKRTCTNTKDINSDINTEETSDIKELLKQSIKNTEIITTMIMEKNSLLKQQTQQITAMLQLLTKTLLNNK
ncbi:hypothetical protein M0802_013739 [Mischocyttarus mexicanus]|nr:hypothetical protein M0802_013739 [Mischocyttarus mexicanus]